MGGGEERRGRGREVRRGDDQERKSRIYLSLSVYLPLCNIFAPSYTNAHARTYTHARSHTHTYTHELDRS